MIVVFHCKFKNIFIHFDILIYRNDEVPLQTYGQPPEIVSLTNSNLFNAMIYPFTRMVVYGAIWYQGNYVAI
jgi:hypothetical protein